MICLSEQQKEKLRQYRHRQRFARLGFFGDYPFQDAPKPYEGPAGPRNWENRAGKFVITGWTGEIRQIAGRHYDRFVLPAGEQVPCLNYESYDCEHWIGAGWWKDGSRYPLCPTCANRKEEPSCGC